MPEHLPRSRGPKGLSLALIWTVLASACAGLPGAKLAPEQIFQRSAPSIVRIQTRRPEGGAVGTGFVVSRGQIATNLHVIDGAEDAWVQSRDGMRFAIRNVVAFDESRDLAIVEVFAPDLTALTLADSDTLDEGERIYAIGNPFGLDYTITEGLFSGRRRLPDSPPVEVLQVSVALAPGSSGGPLLNSRGEVVGVATRTLQGGQALGLGVPSNALRELRDRPLSAGLTFEEFRASRGQSPPVGGHVRDIPKHDLSLIASCSDDDLAMIVRALQGAIQKGAPIYNRGDQETCYRIYEGAALRLVRELPATCAGGRTALDAGLTRAADIESFDDKAWAMRDAFDGMLDVIERRITPE
jgi:serine protease Do